MSHQEMKKALEAQGWNKKRRFFMTKDTSRPIRFKTIQKNTKLAEFAGEDAIINVPAEEAKVD